MEQVDYFKPQESGLDALSARTYSTYESRILSLFSYLSYLDPYCSKKFLEGGQARVDVDIYSGIGY